MTSLRTFEAAARHLSFAKAAHELFVTPSAVGFQIKHLEDELGGPLFLRKHRSVELTDKGRLLAASLTPAFTAIQSAWDAADVSLDTTVLKVSCPEKVAHSWLLPAITSAEGKRPKIRIIWDITNQDRNVFEGEVDIDIRWGMAPKGELHSEPLLRPWFTPLLRPDVARFVQCARDLLNHGLIDAEFALDPNMEESTWASWYRINQLKPPSEFAISCADTASAVETALATGHVALAGSFLAFKQLAKGELVAPFDVAIAPYSRFWLDCRKGLKTSREYTWFLAAIQNSTQTIDAASTEMRVFHPDGSLVID